MGRWCSMPLQGKQYSGTRIISVYVTCVPKNMKQHANTNVFTQQQTALLKLKSTQSVMEAFWTHFWKEIDNFLAQGEKLILCGDWNENIYDREYFKEFYDRNLIPAVISHHENAPATFARGSYPIDEIFVSSSLEIKACGYLEQSRNAGDHRPVWIEVTQADALGINPPPVTSYAARSLKTNDPRIVSKYNKVLEEQFEINGVYNRALNLYNNYSIPLTPTQCAEYDRLDQDRDKAMKYAERKCRKLHTGDIPWSPELQHVRDLKLYIKLTIRRKKGHYVGAQYLIRLSKKAGVNFVYLSLPNLDIELQKANKIYKIAKKNSVDFLRSSFLTSLAEAKEKNGEGKKASIIRRIIRTEEQ